MCTFLERKFNEKYNSDINFLQKITIFEKITKTSFLPFFFQNRLQKNEILKKKLLSNCFIDL